LNGRFSWHWRGNWYTSCDKTGLESIFIAMEGSWFEIPPEAYLTELTDRSGKLCTLSIGINNANYWIGGDTFLMNYYMVFDD